MAESRSAVVEYLAANISTTAWSIKLARLLRCSWAAESSSTRVSGRSRTKKGLSFVSVVIASLSDIAMIYEGDGLNLGIRDSPSKKDAKQFDNPKKPAYSHT
jgi:hypothetical protein